MKAIRCNAVWWQLLKVDEVGHGEKHVEGTTDFGIVSQINVLFCGEFCGQRDAVREHSTEMDCAEEINLGLENAAYVTKVFANATYDGRAIQGYRVDDWIGLLRPS